jgi:hypothetical protein
MAQRSHNKAAAIFVGVVCLFHYAVLVAHEKSAPDKAWTIHKVWDTVLRILKPARNRRPAIVVMAVPSGYEPLLEDTRSLGSRERETASSAAEEEAKEDESIRFPNDRGGQNLTKLLPPSEKSPPPPEDDTPEPRRHPPPNVEGATVPAARPGRLEPKEGTTVKLIIEVPAD